MLDLGLLGLTNPWLLAALIGLPALWWLLRVMPPAPRRLRFPAIRLLLGLQPEEETLGAHAALADGAAHGARRAADPGAGRTGAQSRAGAVAARGPLVLVVDDGWAAAPHWDQRLAALERFTARAQRQEREVILLGTAADPAGSALRVLSAADARAQCLGLAAQALAGRPRGRLGQARGRDALGC